MKIGVHYIGEGKCEFVVWAPFSKKVELKLLSGNLRTLPMQRDERGYWGLTAENILPGDLYLYNIDGKKDLPDPASHFQPEGVHKASKIVDHNAFNWHDDGWQGVPLNEMILYELHVGTFTDEGTFDAIIPRLDELRYFGISGIEIMPVAQFPGERNWGYDSVYPFAVQNSYGGPEGLKMLVNESHGKGIAIILDVVYNHLGPEGNYLRDFGPYFTDRYKSPWGMAVNFDGPYSDEVRNFFIENALYWFEYYHIDALRLDAIHGIYDMSASPFLIELSEMVEEFSRKKGKKLFLIAESDLNNSLIIRPRNRGGYGLDATWCDDFHHSIHTLLTGENDGYYVDFGKIEHLEKSFREGFVYSGQYSVFRKRNHGNSSKDLPADRFIIFSQNHDQVGNRLMGERLSSLVSFEAQKLTAGLVFLSPYVPLLFMGEEYGETAPFLYFISHSEQNLIEAVRQGRKHEFKTFQWAGEPPDPQSVDTFRKSHLDWDKRSQNNHNILLKFYRELIRLRKNVPSLSDLDKERLDVWCNEEKKIMFMRRWKDESNIIAIFNFSTEDAKCQLQQSGTGLQKILDSSDTKWKGPGTLLTDQVRQNQELTVRSKSFALYVKEG